MKERNKASYDRVVLRGILFGLAGGCVLLSLAACNQIVGITQPTLVDGTGGIGGEGGQSATSSNSGSTSGSGGGSGGGTSSGSSSSSSSSSSGSIPCMNSGDCPSDTLCTNWSCMMSTCIAMFRPTGTAVNDPTNGDCKTDVCDGMGATMNVADNSDHPPFDGNSCTTEACDNGSPTSTPVPAGTACPGGTCNAAGVCSSCSNGMMDGDETGVDCGGSACAKCNGNLCAAGVDCKSGFCADGVCCDFACTGTCKSCNLAGTAGTCANIPLNGVDSSPACDGTMVCDGNGGCRLANGQTCVNNAECVSNKCVLNMGNKVCAP